MNKRGILIVLGALVAVAALLALWFWVFSKGGPLSQGLFGRSGTATSSSTTASGGRNVPSTTQGGATVGTNTNVPLGPAGGGGVPPPPYGGSVPITPVQGVESIPGVDWLGGGVGSGGGQTAGFSPTGINQLNGGANPGKLTILGSGAPAPSVDPNYGLVFAAVGIGTALCTAGLLGTNAISGITSGVTAAGLTAADSTRAVPTVSVSGNTLAGAQLTIQGSNTFRDNFLNCITRHVGRAIVNQITASVVNWINGGFKGSPSFVQNYQQFFVNVADQAAGSYIHSSALSFLCSPFQLQVRIAIAQSYARRNAGAACTLSGVTRNVTNFINGNFSAGGWPALLTFTSMPVNNPFGAYAYGQIGLASAQSAALQNANRSITPGGFISFAQTYNCTNKDDNGKLINNSSYFLTPTQAASGVEIPGCKTRIATPGSVIESSLNITEGSTLSQLNLAKSFDEIVSALITQLMTRTLQQGLSNLSGTQGYESNFLTPDQQQAQKEGNDLLVELQSAQNVSQQYGQTEQGSTADIQNAQSQLATLLNCWQNANNAANASSTAGAIAVLEAQVTVHNNNITRANQSIAALQRLQTNLLNITSTAELAAVRRDYNAALSSGAILTQADLTRAQQDRATLQSQLAARNQQTQAELAQCQATTP